MGASESKDLMTNMDAFFKGRLEGVDLVMFASQECKMKLKTQRIYSLEQYMNRFGFSNIDTDYANMWEMFLIVFVRDDLLEDVTKVRKMFKPKGKNLVV